MEGGLGLEALLGLIVGILFTAGVLMIVSNMKVGLKVDNFKSAVVAAIAIGIVNFILVWILGML